MMIAKNLRIPIPFLLTSLLSAMLMLGGCQPKDTQDSSLGAGDTTGTADTHEKLTKKEADLPARQSDSASAQIAKFQPIFVTQMQTLQRRLQAEFDALQAADAADDRGVPTATTSTDTAAKNSDLQTKDLKTDKDKLTISAEVGKRDLEVLKRVTLTPKAPSILSENELIDRYQSATTALYEPTSKTLSGEQIDTLLNIAAVIPEVFDNLEIAERLTLKSPALSRLIVRYQIWQQIEAQQATDIENVTSAQQKEFDNLVSKFDETIKGYDEQIAEYEKTLKAIKKK